MRENIDNKNHFIIRLEKDFTKALHIELIQKPLNEIRISDLCASSNYPRSTFYKYYYDLQDLFTDYLGRIFSSLDITNKDDLYALFHKILSLQESNKEYEKIYRNNNTCEMFRKSVSDELKKYILKNPSLIGKYSDYFHLSVEEFIVDYIINNMQLLMQYKDRMSGKSFRAVSRYLLSPKSDKL